MELNFVDAHTPHFDPQMYVRMLFAIAKSDKENGPKEFEYIRRQAQRLGMDYEYLMQTTGTDFFIEKQGVSRLTALMVLKDAIFLASMDRHFSLPERQRVLEYAEKLDISRRDIARMEELIKEYRSLAEHWRLLVETP